MKTPDTTMTADTFMTRFEASRPLVQEWVHHILVQVMKLPPHEQDQALRQLIDLQDDEVRNNLKRLIRILTSAKEAVPMKTTDDKMTAQLKRFVTTFQRLSEEAQEHVLREIYLLHKTGNTQGCPPRLPPTRRRPKVTR